MNSENSKVSDAQIYKDVITMWYYQTLVSAAHGRI